MEWPYSGVELLCNPALPLLGIYPKRIESRDSHRCLYACIYSSVNSQQPKDRSNPAVHGQINACMKCIYRQWNIKASRRKEILAYAITRVNLEDIMLSEISHKTNTVWFLLPEVPEGVTFIETERTRVVGWVGRNGSYCRTGIEFFVIVVCLFGGPPTV